VVDNNSGAPRDVHPVRDDEADAVQTERPGAGSIVTAGADAAVVSGLTVAEDRPRAPADGTAVGPRILPERRPKVRSREIPLGCHRRCCPSAHAVLSCIIACSHEGSGSRRDRRRSRRLCDGGPAGLRAVHMMPRVEGYAWGPCGCGMIRRATRVGRRRRAGGARGQARGRGTAAGSHSEAWTRLRWRRDRPGPTAAGRDRRMHATATVVERPMEHDLGLRQSCRR